MMKKIFLTRKRLLLAVVAILLATLLVFVLEKNGIINLYKNKGVIDTDTTTTSTQPSAQADFTAGDDRQIGSTLREDEGSASVIDNGGSIDNSIDKSQPTISSTGEIALFAPKENTRINTQIHIAGTSTLNTVVYRVVDSISGVINSGELNVVNGQFSGTLNIDTPASEGRLDVFGRQADGNEFSNLAIPLRFR